VPTDLAAGPVDLDRSFRCSGLSADLQEPMAGTASRVSSWLLLEQPAPWGREPLVHGRLPKGLGRALAGRAQAAGVRVVLIRRPDRPNPALRRCLVAHVGQIERWIEGADLDRPAAVLDLDLFALAEGRSPGLGPRSTEPVFLVCTHGRRDPCCAERGRPLARALCAARDDAWECSHIGGDRFAANLVCLPLGVYLGRLGPAEGLRAVSSLADGRLDLEHLRGWTWLPEDAQVATLALRRETGWDGVDDVRVVARHGSPDRRTVDLRGPDGRTYRVDLTIQAVDPRRLTCHSASPVVPRTWAVRALTTL
jgi:hypothetical protein